MNTAYEQINIYSHNLYKLLAFVTLTSLMYLNYLLILNRMGIYA